MNALREWAAPWGDLASIAGCLLAIVGFCWTIRIAMRSRTAAQEARKASQETRAHLLRASSIGDFSAALSIMEEIRRLHRLPAVWITLLDRYASLNEKLNRFVAATPTLKNADRLGIGIAIKGMRSIEH